MLIAARRPGTPLAAFSSVDTTPRLTPPAFPKQALHLVHVRTVGPGPCPIVCDKGLAGAGVEAAMAATGSRR